MDHSQPISFNNTSNSQQNNFNNGPPIMNHGLYNQTLSNQISYLGIKQDANSNNQPQVPLTAPHNNMNNYNSSSSSPAFNRPPLLSPIQPSNVPSHSHTLLTSSQPPQNPLLNRSLQHTPVSYHPSQVNSSQTQQFSQFNANTPPLIPSSQPLANSSPIPPQLIGLPPQKLVQTQQNAYHVSSSAPIGPPVSRQLPTSMSSPYPPIVSQFPPSSTNVPSAYHISPAPPIGPPVIGQVNPTSPSSAYPALSAASIGPPVAGRPPPTSLFNSYSTSTTAPIGAPVASRPPTTSASRASEFSAAPIGPPVAGRPPPTSMMNSYSISAAAPVGPPTAGRPTPTSVPSSYPASSAASIGPPGAGLSTSNYNTGSVSSIGPPIAGRPPPTSVSNYGVPFNDIDKSKTNLPPPPNSSLSGPPIGPLRGIVPGPPMPGVPPMIPSTTPMSSYQNVNGPTSGMSGLPRGPYDNTLSSPPMGLSGPVGPPLGHPSNAASPPSSMPPGTKSSIQSRYPAMQQPINHQAPTLPPMDTSRYPDNRGAHGLTQKMGQMSVTNQGFDQLWGHEMLDLMQCRCIVPEYPEDPPEIRLGQHFDEATNCSPEIFRCTVNKIPETNSLLQKSRLPLGILIHPFKDLDHLPVIQCSTIVRCRVCRTYINPFVYFVDSKRWKCNLCFRVNDLPEEFQYDPVSKSYGDPSRRPEIKSATIEFIAPAEYMLRPPQPAVYLFLLDVSQLARESGYLQVFCETLKNNLDQLPGDARTQVGFICFDEHVHYYLMSDELNRPKEMTILDIDDVFVPMPSQLVANLRERRALLQQLLAELPRRFGASPRAAAASALGPALLAAHKLLTSTGGRIAVFQTCLPNIGPGALTPREDPNARSGKEVAHLAPATDFYKRLALDCSSAQVAIDLFLLNSQYADLATLSGMSKFSGGSVQHEPLFASRAGAAGRLSRAFSRYLRRKLGFEAVMRVRCTRGVTIHTFHGNFFVRSTDLLSLPNVSPDAGFGMQLSIEESLSDLQQVCFQAALLYTSSKGERRIRVHTLALPVASNLTEVLHAADQQCIIGLLSKMAVDRAVSASMTEAREALTNVAVEALGAVKLAAHASSSGPLLAPRSLSQLPLLILALLKRPALRTGASTRLDDRVADMCRLKSLPLHQLMRLVYPSLYPIHQLAETTDLPRLQLSSDRLSANGCYLLDDGEVMTIYVCHGVSVEFLKSVFGVQSFAELKEDLKEMPADTLLSDFIDGLNEDRPYPSDVVVIKDNSPSRTLFTERLIQDRTENFLSYYEFLQHVQSQIK